jgi:hypothetical protein
MEDDLKEIKNGRQPQIKWKTTSKKNEMEDDPPSQKKMKMEKNL